MGKGGPHNPSPHPPSQDSGSAHSPPTCALTSSAYPQLRGTRPSLSSTKRGSWCSHVQVGEPPLNLTGPAQSQRGLYSLSPRRAEAGAQGALEPAQHSQEAPPPRSPGVLTVRSSGGQPEAATTLHPSSISHSLQSPALAIFAKNTLRFPVTVTNTCYSGPVCILT